MEALGWVSDWIVPFIVVLGILVFIHEMGHFLVARLCGVRVEAFSIGFGPELAGWNDRRGTRWKVCLLPLGGYVKFFGDASAASTPDGDDLQEMSAEERAVCFHHKPLAQRAAVVAAGPAANYLLAIAIFAGLFMTQGQPATDPVVSEVMAGSAAEAAGLQPDDRFVAIDGAAIDRFQELQDIIRLNPGTPITITVERDGRAIDLEAVPDVIVEEDDFGRREIGRLGVQNKTGHRFVVHDPISAVASAVDHTWAITAMSLRAVGQIITGERSVKEMGGPVRIAHMSGEVAQRSWLTLINFMGLLSISLGLINLFPIPVLDGGHLLYYAIEAVRGKPLGARAQEVGFTVGLALVVGLMLVVTVNDLSQGPFLDFLTALVS